jgi:hypothetical protein
MIMKINKRILIITGHRRNGMVMAPMLATRAGNLMQQVMLSGREISSFRQNIKVRP